MRSYLNEHSLRPPSGFRLCRPEALRRLWKLKDWSPRQQVILTEMHRSLLATRERRTRLRRMMALEMENDPKLLRLYKLSGLSLVTTYALIAIIGDIGRFAHSKNLVSYLGLNPSVVESGTSKGGTALQAHGRGSLRSILIQSAKMLLRTENPLQKWGLSVALRRGSNKAAVVVARSRAERDSPDRRSARRVPPEGGSNRSRPGLAHPEGPLEHGPGRGENPGHKDL